MKLSRFDKGLSTRLDPTLIGVDEAVRYTNIDNTNGLLTSAKNYTLTDTAIQKWFYLFNDIWYSSDNERDYIEYKGNLYFTEENSIAQKIVNDIQKDLGIAGPETKLTSAENATGSLTGVTMELPTGVGEGVAYSPDGNYFAIAHQTSPYVSIYRQDGNTCTKLDNPNILPTGNGKAVRFSPSGQYLAVVHETSPYITVYKINGESYTKIADPATPPTGAGQGVTWSADSVYLSVAHTTSPYVTIYKPASDVLTKLADPGTLPAGNGQAVSFSEDTNFLTVAHTTTPFITIYSRAADVFTKIANPASLPASTGMGVTWSADGVYMAVAHTTTPFVTIYSVSGSTFTKLSDPASLPAGNGLGCHFSPNYDYLAVSHEVTPFVTIYSRSGSTFTKVTNPDVLPTGIAYGCRFSPDNSFLVVVHATTPFVTIYDRVSATFSKYINASVLQYTYTYYDSTEGVESTPAPLSDELNIGDGKSVDLSDFIPSDNPNANLIRLYRLGADTTELTLLVELDASTLTYNDNIATLDAIGTILASEDYNTPISGLQFLTLAYGMLFAAKGRQVYYTKVGLPDAWPSSNVINLDHDVTGILPVQDGIIFFFENKFDILIGDSPEKFVLLHPTTEQGCRNHKSCKIVKTLPVWISDDGICMYQNGLVTILTKDKLGLTTLDIVNTAIYDEHYYICLQDGTILAMDLRFGLCFENFEFFEVDVSNIIVASGDFYAVIDDFIATMFDGEQVELSYLSPEFTEGDATVTKSYNNIYVRSTGDFTFKCLIDGIQVSQYDITGNTIHDLTIPQEKQRGSSIQFDIIGTGTVKEIEYKVVGRQNGR